MPVDSLVLFAYESRVSPQPAKAPGSAGGYLPITFWLLENELPAWHKQTRTCEIRFSITTSSMAAVQVVLMVGGGSSS
jgi:hypothetical protein